MLLLSFIDADKNRELRPYLGEDRCRHASADGSDRARERVDAADVTGQDLALDQEALW
jgi:hypothetical protein